MRRRLRDTIAVLAVAYPVSLFIATLLFRFLGEEWWVTGVALYLPRFGFALPLVVILPALWAFRMKRLLLLQVVSALLVLFPLMGLVLPWFRPSVTAPKVRVLSLNVNSSYGGDDQVVRAILAFDPDVVLLQESLLWSRIEALLKKRYPVVQTSTQFALASRFPVIETTDPPRIPHGGRDRSPRFLRHVIETPLGRLAVYNIHPLSPRHSFYAFRGERGLRREILSGRVFDGVAGSEFEDNATLRSLQVRAFTEQARRESLPVVLAGDTNLPGLSVALSRDLGTFRDGFRSASFGFGYTYPAKRPWMRLDRIFTSDSLAIANFEVGCPGVSDHLCVVADVHALPRED